MTITRIEPSTGIEIGIKMLNTASSTLRGTREQEQVSADRRTDPAQRQQEMQQGYEDGVGPWCKQLQLVCSTWKSR